MSQPSFLTLTIYPSDHPNTSVTKITLAGGASCTIYGAQGSVTTVVGANYAYVGPPQPQVSGACIAL